MLTRTRRHLPQEPSLGDSAVVQRFVRDMQVLAGRIDALGTPQVLSLLEAALRRIPETVGPLAFWTVRGLAGGAVQHIACSRHLGAADSRALSSIFQAPSTRALSVAVRRSIAEMSGALAGASGDPRVDEALRYLRQHCTRHSLTLNEVCRAVRLSRWHLGRLLTRYAGASYRQVLRELRMERATGLLAEGVLSVKEIAARLGYAYATEFARDFRRRFGMTPTAWRRAAQSVHASHKLRASRERVLWSNPRPLRSARSVIRS